MFKKAGTLALPLIVLAGMRRCPQMRMPCACSEAEVTSVLILASILVLSIGFAVVLKARSAALKA